MKKLLTLLLTLVMAVCLVNLNNNYTKAEETNGTTYNLGDTQAGWASNPPIPNNTISNGDVLKITANYKDITFKDECGKTVIIPIGQTHTYKCKQDNVIVNFDMTAITLAVVTKGIVFDSSGTLKEMIDGSYTDITGNETRKKELGITYTPAVGTGNPTLTFSKNIYKRSDDPDNTATIKFENNVNIKLSNDIIIYNSSIPTFPVSALELTNNGQATDYPTTNVDGNNHSLTLKSSGCALIWSSANATLNLKNTRLNAKSSAANVFGIDVMGQFNINENNEVQITSSGADGAALHSDGAQQVFPLADYDIKGKVNLTDTSLSDATRNATSGEYEISGSDAKFITIRKDTPTPIGPTPGTDEMPYDATNGFTLTFDSGKANTATAHILGATPSELTSVDEGTKTLVENTDYKVYEGSIKVQFQKSYLNSLSPGKHRITITIGTNTYPVTFTVNNPSSPSKKDESCEKVIGPTWHWNNDKGICEDYGVVGTSTR